MGCASSKDGGTADEAKEQSKDTDLAEVSLSSAPVTNAAGRRVSKTVRRVAVRCAIPAVLRDLPSP
jgi:hypothetical protein